MVLDDNGRCCCWVAVAVVVAVVVSRLRIATWNDPDLVVAGRDSTLLHVDVHLVIHVLYFWDSMDNRTFWEE